MSEKEDTRASTPDPAAGAASGRRTYHAPVLVEYGSIARLTHTNGTTVREGGNPRTRATCL